MPMDWVSVFLGIVTVLVFLAIFTLLRTMSSPYIARFRTIVHSSMNAIEGLEDAHRICFERNGRKYELLEVKYQVQEERNKVYNSYILLLAKSKTDFTLHLDDVLNKISVAGVMEKVMGVAFDYKCYPLDGRDYPEIYKDFKILTNDVNKAQRLLKDPGVLDIIKVLKAQFSAYGFVMPFVINKGDLIIDYSLSKHLLDELVFDPRKIFEHIRMLDELAKHIETA